MPILDISEIFGQSSKSTAKRIPEAAVADLRILFGEYRAFLDACPFKPGDLVTPKVGYGVKGAGEPHIVVEVDRPFLSTLGEMGSNVYGKRLDMRIAQFVGEQRHLYWVESYAFEPWPAPAEAEPAVEESARYPDSYDPTDIDDVKIAVLQFLGDGEKEFMSIANSVDGSFNGICTAVRELLLAGDIALREEGEKDFYRIVLEGETS